VENAEFMKAAHRLGQRGPRGSTQKPLEPYTFKHVKPAAVIIIRRNKMGRGILLWLLGVPIPIIILLALFYR